MKTMNKFNRFITIYDKQVEFQRFLNQGLSIPNDSPDKFKNQMLLMFEELGEVLNSDKRWRSFRGESYSKEDKLKELADVLIVFMNLCIFSGLEAYEILDATGEKILENFKRFLEVQKM